MLNSYIVWSSQASEAGVVLAKSRRQAIFRYCKKLGIKSGNSREVYATVALLIELPTPENPVQTFNVASSG